MRLRGPLARSRHNGAFSVISAPGAIEAQGTLITSAPTPQAQADIWEPPLWVPSGDRREADLGQPPDGVAQGPKSAKNVRVALSKAPISRAKALDALVWLPPAQAPLRGPVGTPEPLARPCMRQRTLPLTAGPWHGGPVRVRVRQRGARAMFATRTDAIQY